VQGQLVGSGQYLRLTDADNEPSAFDAVIFGDAVLADVTRAPPASPGTV
jgi:hypothetical protein